MTISKAFAVDNCAFYGHGSVVSVVGSGICSSIDAVSQCSDGSYYYAGTANGVTDSYDAAMTALGCGSYSASSTQSRATGRIVSGSSSQTSNANANFTNSVANGLNGNLNRSAPAVTQTQAEQKTTDNKRSEKPVQQSTPVPQSQAGKHITDNQSQSVAQSVKAKTFTPPLAPESLIPAELQPLKPTTVPTPSNQTVPEIPNPAVNNTAASHFILLMAIAVLCLCLAGIICFGIKRFSAEKN